MAATFRYKAGTGSGCSSVPAGCDCGKFCGRRLQRRAVYVCFQRFTLSPSTGLSR